MEITRLKIRFSMDWDKLGNLDGFTTIRKFTPEKYDYYVQNIGHKFEVWVCENYFYDTILKSVAIVEPKNLDPKLLEEDTRIDGKIQQDWYNRILHTKKAILLEFARVKLAVITDLAEFEGYFQDLERTKLDEIKDRE